uniref:BTB domain-containing protein n=1 Tax=Panagrolaimus davidi TaxID=227884 RepID=A0A914PEP5_9BILA
MENIFEQECNFEMKWIIPRSKFEAVKNLHYCKSDIFKAAIPGVTFALRLNPNGIENVNGNTYICLCLNIGMMESVYCNFTISIKSAACSKNFIRNFETSSNFGGAITGRQEFENPAAFCDNNVIVELEGKMKGTGLKIDIERKKHVPLIQALVDRSDMDVTLHTADQEIKVHKYILTNRSQVFTKMLKCKKDEFIKLSEFSTPVVKAVIDFCYGKDIKGLINLQNAVEFLGFSDKFKMEDLKNTTEEYLIQQISDENVCRLSNKSVEFNAKLLRECCICFLLLKKPDEISNILNWEILDKEICQEIVQRALAFVSKNCFF